MCGIVGYKGPRKAIPVLIAGLKALEYRGYDSAGIAYIKDKEIICQKNIGKVNNLTNILDEDMPCHIGIAHTRWATHGGVTKENAHPHHQGKITLVHNGIIENYAKIKEELSNYHFKGETDSEILAALIDKLYEEEKSMLKAIQKMMDVVQGSYALLILNSDEKDTIYAVRNNSPLIVSQDGENIYFASDIPAILDYTSKYYLLNNKDIVMAKKTLAFYDEHLNEITKKINTFTGSIESAQKGEYEHYMLKEINEEPKVIHDILTYYLKDDHFNSSMPKFKKYQKVYIVGCGSAYYTGEISKYLWEKYLDIPVQTYLASEFRYQKVFYDQETLVIFISQSGETADTLEALRKTKSDGIDTLALVNAYGSSIAREADMVLYLKAGLEIAVATTKAFTAQLCLLALIMVRLMDKEEYLKYFKEIEKNLDLLLKEDYQKYAKKIYQTKEAFFIGRGLDFGLCEEGSLKLKEISYINSAAFAAGELKHGTISLIENNTPVIAIATNKELRSKTISNIKEVKARGAYVLYLTNEKETGDFYNDIITIPHVHEIVDSIFMVLPLQLLAYHVAYLKGEDIDKPRNLAKSVTVE